MIIEGDQDNELSVQICLLSPSRQLPWLSQMLPFAC